MAGRQLVQATSRPTDLHLRNPGGIPFLLLEGAGHVQADVRSFGLYPRLVLMPQSFQADVAHGRDELPCFSQAAGVGGALIIQS